MIAASTADPPVGASTWASGSQVWTGHIGTFTENAANRAKNSQTCACFDSGTLYQSRSAKLWPASLYGTLDELEEAGLIEELDNPRRPADESEKKRFYRLSRAGHRALAAETDRLAAVVKVARSRLKPRSGDVS